MCLKLSCQPETTQTIPRLTLLGWVNKRLCQLRLVLQKHASHLTCVLVVSCTTAFRKCSLVSELPILVLSLYASSLHHLPPFCLPFFTKSSSLLCLSTYFSVPLRLSSVNISFLFNSTMIRSIFLFSLPKLHHKIS